MLCPKCHTQLNNNGSCPNCGYTNGQYEQDVQTMTNNEAQNYHGVTIEEEGNFDKERSANTNDYRQSSYQRQARYTRSQYTQSGRGVNVRFINLGTSSRRSNWLTRGLFAIGTAAVLAFFFFVALPALLTLVGVGIVAWLIFRFFRKR